MTKRVICCNKECPDFVMGRCIANHDQVEICALKQWKENYKKWVASGKPSQPKKEY